MDHVGSHGELIFDIRNTTITEAPCRQKYKDLGIYKHKTNVIYHEITTQSTIKVLHVRRIIEAVLGLLSFTVPLLELGTD